MRILVGGVPFGRNNVGDEAILECVIRILREERPDAEFSVSTDDGPATARKLGIRAVPLFGFAPPYSRDEMAAELRSHDAFVWAGATGLSDYPEIPVEMLRIAQAAGRRTVVWNVGMNDELNPAKYRVLPGKRRFLLRMAGAASLGLWDGVAWEERRRVERARARIAGALDAADLVVVRDPESRGQVTGCGVRRDVVTGADSALLLEPDDGVFARLPEDARRAMEFPGPKVGLCVSAQREIRDTRGLVGWLDGVVADGTRRVIFIPMNPLTDSKLMAGLRASMRHPDRAAVMEGRYEPAEVLSVAARCDLIASSRLHLIIFASIVHTPFIGISRGSKVDNFLAPYGLTSVGSVEQCDFARFESETHRLLAGKAAFQERSREVRVQLLARLAMARGLLKRALETPAPARG